MGRNRRPPLFGPLLPPRFRQPQYLLHPLDGLRRILLRSAPQDGSTTAEKRLPWDVRIEYVRDQAIGQSIAIGGVFDLCVTETLFRLLDPGETAVDVGANIGYMTCVMATRVGPTGTVLAYEPHPHVFQLLARNVERWNDDPRLATIEATDAALSATAGVADLFAPQAFERNVGAASLSASAKWGRDPQRVAGVRLRTADGELKRRGVALMKIDVEGHEEQVLRGASLMLAEGGVRDILFEHKQSYPSELTRLLEDNGFDVLSLDNTFFGPTATPAAERQPRQGWEGPSYLATRQAGRAHDRLRPRGWVTLGRRRALADAHIP